MTVMPSTPAAGIVWMPWEPSVAASTPFAPSRPGEGAGELRLALELLDLGVSASLTDRNTDYDIDTDIGRIEVKAPDASGRFVTAGRGHEMLAPFISECSLIMRMFEPMLPGCDPEFADIFRGIQRRLDRGNFTHSALQFVMDVAETMRDIPGPWNAVRHEWTTDPALLAGDCLVFPSQCVVGDHIALTCESGYALLTKFDADNIFRFQGDAWGGRPKFHSEQATNKHRKQALKNTHAYDKRNKIAATQRLKRDLRRKEIRYGDHRGDA